MALMPYEAICHISILDDEVFGQELSHRAGSCLRNTLLLPLYLAQRRPWKESWGVEGKRGRGQVAD